MKPFEPEKPSADADKARRKKGIFHSSRMLQLLSFLMQLDFFYCLLITGFYVQAVMKKGTFEPLRYVGMLLFFAMLYASSRIFKKLWQILLLDLAVIVLAGLLYPLSYSKVWMILALLLFGLIDILTKGDPSDRARGLVWFAENSAYWGVGIGILLVISTIIGYGKSLDGQSVSCAGLNLIFLCVFLAEYFVQRYVFLIYDHYHKVRKMDMTDRQHVRRIVSFSAVVGTGIALCLYLFSGAFAKLAAWIVSLFAGGGAEKISEGVLETETPRSVSNGVSGITGNGNRILNHTGPQISLLFTNVIVKVAVFALLLFALLTLYRWLCRSHYMEEKTDDIVTVIDKKETVVSKPKGVLSQLRYGNSGNEQIRRMFRRFVLDRLPDRKYDIRHMTADEIASLLRRTGVDRDTAGEMADLYAFARYSGKPADTGQVQRMRSLCRCEKNIRRP